MIDYHVHTNYSADASATVTEQLEAAAERGLSEICFTDHVDFDNGDKSMPPSDLGALREQLFCLSMVDLGDRHAAMMQRYRHFLLL